MRRFPFFSFHEILVKNLFIVVHLITFHILHHYFKCKRMNPRFNKDFYLKAFFFSSIIIPQRLNNNCTHYHQSYVIILSRIINNTARNAKLTTHKMQKRYSRFIDNCHAYLKASSPLISFARNANSQQKKKRYHPRQQLNPPHPVFLKPSQTLQLCFWIFLTRPDSIIQTSCFLLIHSSTSVAETDDMPARQ